MTNFKTLFLAILVTVVGCGGGGGGESSSDTPFFGGNYSGKLDRVSGDCSFPFTFIDDSWTVNQNGEQVVLQEDPGRASYSGMITGADSFTTSATDGCGTVTYQVEEITSSSAAMTYVLDFNGSCLLTRKACNAVFSGIIARR